MSERPWREEYAILRLQRTARMCMASAQRAENWRQIRLMVSITVIAVSVANLAGLI